MPLDVVFMGTPDFAVPTLVAIAAAGHRVLAACLQHEIDHLNGVLFVDHISALKRNMLLRKLAKELKSKARD